MADILNFFTDIDMKDIALSPPVGVASIVKTDDPTKPDLTKISNWDEIGQFTGTEKIYRKNINSQSGIGLGGTGAIATLFSPENWVTGDTPKIIDGSIRNAFFINCVNMSSGDTPVYRGYVFYINGQQYHDTENDKWIFSPYVMLGTYRADPQNEITTKAERTSYWYYTAGDYEVHAEVSAQYDWDSNSQFNQIAMYSCVIEEKDYFLFVLGVNNGALHPSHDTSCMLIPRSYFKYNIPKPYVGPVTPESAAGITPPSRGLYDDTIRPRNIDQAHQNPFGFNEGNGVYLVLQNSNQYRYFLDCLYHASIGDGLNSGVTGTLGYSQRPTEQIQVMTQGVLSCKMMPKFTVNGLSQCHKYSICGYSLGLDSAWSVLDGTGMTVNEIALVRKDFGFITRTYYNFLDFEPYTSMTLHIPFLGDIAIDPSVVYDNRIILEGYVDYFTGLLSLSVILQKDAAHSYIYTTLQGNCAVDVPIVGAGSSSTQAIGKIASGLGKLTANPVNGVFGVLQGISQVGKSIPITQNAQSSLAAMFSPRSVYLTINTPLPENPSNYAALMGTVVRKEGTVGQYAGYSEFSAVNLNTVVATDAEKEEIERLLRTGVFV